MMSHSHFLTTPAYIAVPYELQKKLFVSKRILKENYLTLLREGTDLMELMDKDKISFRVSLTELNSVLETGAFSKGEQAYIRRMRHQGRNNVAAKRLREKKRNEELSEEESIRSLCRQRQLLQREKQLLSSEIEYYKAHVASFSQ